MPGILGAALMHSQRVAHEAVIRKCILGDWEPDKLHRYTKGCYS
jgi:hypothetical protein